MIPNSILKNINDSFIDDLSNNYSFDIRSLNFDCVLVLPHSSFVEKIGSKYFKNIYSLILESLLNRFENIGVKYHPRENSGDFLEIDNDVVKLIPNSIPLELVWISLMKNPPLIVIGDISTGLLTCNLVFKNKTSIISTANILDVPVEYNLVQFFDNIGVEMPMNITEFYKTINKIS
ncbi:polysialyltransferase family glycosyltransferase [Methanohalophilus sp. WG1-DM]|uniref:polysialyltransferase family glycosyltransferase n=1 Tax=Methanohalophilus sp. WG1-DM TaxID=2491675 RepID=UPI000FFF29D0|nr:polysialyltransferase family glycosyltransferase [Methanohalophilus sp. WG1-DM]RXG33519.1 hypothetical protein CI957_1831 [Methanohalophilus sp. WG1-DM]